MTITLVPLKIGDRVISIFPIDRFGSFYISHHTVGGGYEQTRIIRTFPDWVPEKGQCKYQQSRQDDLCRNCDV